MKLAIIPMVSAIATSATILFAAGAVKADTEPKIKIVQSQPVTIKGLTYQDYDRINEREETPFKKSHPSDFYRDSVVDVVATIPAQQPTLLQQIKRWLTGEKTVSHHTRHFVGAYVGKGLFLVSNFNCFDNATYRASLSVAQDVELQPYRVSQGFTLLQMKEKPSFGVPFPAHVVPTSPSPGDEVIVYGGKTTLGDVRHIVQSKGYVSADSVSLFENKNVPFLFSVKTDQNKETDFGPIFADGRLIGMTAFSDNGEAYAISGDVIASRLAAIMADM